MSSMTDKVYHAILKRGEVTITQILGMVGNAILPTHALRLARSGRPGVDARNTLERVIEMGRRRIIVHALGSLKRRGKIVGLGGGRYVVPKPKLMDRERSA